MKPANASPDTVADELTERHITATGCEECYVLEDDLCRFHTGYREGTLVLLLRAVAQ